MFDLVRTLLRSVFRRHAPLSKEPVSLGSDIQSYPEAVGDIDRIDAPGRLVPYDENLLERARTQWQFGDWGSLAQLDREVLQLHPDRAKLALLAASGHLQLGQTEFARQFLRLARDWGCNQKLISQVLIAGVHNSIGRAAALAGQEQRAQAHFESSLKVGMPTSDFRLLSQARIRQQLADLGLGSGTHIGVASVVASGNLAAVVDEKRHIADTEAHGDKAVLKCSRPLLYELGECMVDAQSCSITHGTCQTVLFFRDENTLKLIQRDLLSNRLASHEIKGLLECSKSQNVPDLGIDAAGHLHICVEQAGKLLWLRTSQPTGVASWDDACVLQGEHDETMDMPVFIMPGSNLPLRLLYRCSSRAGKILRVKTYDEGSGRWSDQDVSFNLSRQPTEIVCWGRPVASSDGVVHWSFVCDMQPPGGGAKALHICYVVSADNGLTWSAHIRGDARTAVMPFAFGLAAPDLGSGVSAAWAMALDDMDRPHFVYRAVGVSSQNQYEHLWFDGAEWRLQSILIEDFLNSVHAHDSRSLLHAAPLMVSDERGDMLLVDVAASRQGGVSVKLLKSPEYDWHPGHACRVLDGINQIRSVTVDYKRWCRDKALSLMIQYGVPREDEVSNLIISNRLILVEVCTEVAP